MADPTNFPHDVFPSREVSANDSKEEISAGDHQMGYEAWQAVLIATVCSCIVAATLLGNVLVCLSVILVRKLRTPSNWLIVSLALADLLVALMVMPLATVYEIMGVWKFGKVLCDVWTSSDVLLCTASIFNLCAISIDRYLTITRPFDYAAKRTPSRMALMIVSVWVLSALITIPPLFGWRAAPAPDRCELSQDVAYQFYATVGAFYLPLFVMIFVYYRIFVVSDRVRKTEAKLQPLNSSPSPVNHGYSTPYCRSRAPSRQASRQCLYFDASSGSGGGGVSSQRRPSTSNLVDGGTSVRESGDKVAKTLTFGTANRLEVYDPRTMEASRSLATGRRRLSQQPESKSASNLGAISSSDDADDNGGSGDKRPQRHSFDFGGFGFFSRRTSATPSQASKSGRAGDKQSKIFSFGRATSSSSSSSREHRTTKTLGIIMGSFIICWLPFFILALIRPLLGDQSVIPHWIGSSLLWLGFANSLLNPVIYARFNRDFRTPFKHILMCRCRDLDAKLRMETYTEKYGVCQASFDAGSRIQLNALNYNCGQKSRRESSIGSSEFIKITREDQLQQRPNNNNSGSNNNKNNNGGDNNDDDDDNNEEAGIVIRRSSPVLESASDAVENPGKSGLENKEVVEDEEEEEEVVKFIIVTGDEGTSE